MYRYTIIPSTFVIHEQGSAVPIYMKTKKQARHKAIYAMTTYLMTTYRSASPEHHRFILTVRARGGLAGKRKKELI